jgi:hypothetical protein
MRKIPCGVWGGAPYFWLKFLAQVLGIGFEGEDRVLPPMLSGNPDFLSPLPVYQKTPRK